MNGVIFKKSNIQSTSSLVLELYIIRRSLQSLVRASRSQISFLYFLISITWSLQFDFGPIFPNPEIRLPMTEGLGLYIFRDSWRFNFPISHPDTGRKDSLRVENHHWTHLIDTDCFCCEKRVRAWNTWRIMENGQNESPYLM